AEFAAAPFTAVLTERQAERFFGADWRDADLSTATLSIDTSDYAVVGIVANPPANSHFTYSIALHRPLIDYWGPRLYLEAAPGETAAGLSERIDENFASINVRLTEDELFGGVILQPLRSIHLNSDLLYELKPPGKPAYLYLIGIIALVILLLTLSNYTNLSVAMNAQRAREIGMRKVFGASTGQIAGQFLLEAVLLSCLTVPVALLALYFLVPRFDALMGTGLAEDAGVYGGYWWLLLVIAVGVGLLASAYPAIFLARQRILGLFHRKLGGATGQGFPVRKVIITLQFVLLIGLCSLALFVNRQLQYLLDKDLGYQTENILYVNLNADSSRFATFRDQLLRLPEVTGVGSGSPLGQNPYNQTTYQLAGTAEVFDDANNVYLDYRSLDLLGVDNSIPEYVTNPDEAPASMILINETLAERFKNLFQLTDAELIGKTIIQEPEYVNEETGEVGFPYVVGGTFADINMFSLRERVDPMFLTVYKNPRYVYWAAIRYQNASPAEMLVKVRAEYDRLNLNQAFVHGFLRDNLRELYEEEARIAKLSTYFSLAAFLTAILGLIALTAYLTTVRRREIGIRKILGASQGDILRRFNLEYLP
ncbi:MAG: FtsX-like permease family protein, partial [Bacteroidota bacterium]